MSPRNKDLLGKEIDIHSNLNWKNIVLLLGKDERIWKAGWSVVRLELAGRIV